jgi:hypothetical protein
MKQQGPRPGMRHHEYWCAILNGGRCNCDDDPPGPRIPRRRLPSGGAPSPTREKEREELEEA